jgi:hypothetical protein
MPKKSTSIPKRTRVKPKRKSARAATDIFGRVRRPSRLAPDPARQTVRGAVRQLRWGKRRPWHKVELTPAAWAEVRRLVETSPQSLTAIAAEYDMSVCTLRYRVMKEGWTRFRPPPVDVSPAMKLAAKIEAAAAAAGERTSPLEASPSPRAEEMEAADERVGALQPAHLQGPPSLDEAIDALLRQVQALIPMVEAARRQMEESGDFTQLAALARDVASLTTSLRRLKSMRRDLLPQTEPNDDPDAALSAEAADLDARRDALAHRSEIIVAEWRDADAAGQIH